MTSFQGKHFPSQFCYEMFPVASLVKNKADSTDYKATHSSENEQQASACMSANLTQTQEAPYPQCTAAGSVFAQYVFATSFPVLIGQEMNILKDDPIGLYCLGVQQRNSGLWCSTSLICLEIKVREKPSVERETGFPHCFLLQPFCCPYTPAPGVHGTPQSHPPNKCPSEFLRSRTFLQPAPRARVTEVLILFPHECMLKCQTCFSPLSLKSHTLLVPCL